MSTSSFFLRVSSLPVVEGSYNLAASILSYVKEKNEYAKSAISTTENTLSSLKSTTKKYVGPVQNKLQPQLHFIDEKATKGLDYVEGKLPIIAKPPGEILQATCSAVSTGAHKLMELKIVNQITNSALNASCSLKDRLAPHVIDYFLADLQQRGVKVNGEHALTVEHFIVNALPIVKSILMAVQQSVGDCATEGKARIVEIVDDEISAHERANANKQGGEVLQN